MTDHKITKIQAEHFTTVIRSAIARADFPLLAELVPDLTIAEALAVRDQGAKFVRTEEADTVRFEHPKVAAELRIDPQPTRLSEAAPQRSRKKGGAS